MTANLHDDVDLTTTAVHDAFLELVVEKRAALGQPMAEEDVARLNKYTEYDLGLELCRLGALERVAIPAGAPDVSCRSCGQSIYWIPGRVSQYRESISIDGPGCRAPTADVPGVGFPHLADCPKSGLRTKEK